MRLYDSNSVPSHSLQCCTDVVIPKWTRHADMW